MSKIERLVGCVAVQKHPCAHSPLALFLEIKHPHPTLPKNTYSPITICPLCSLKKDCGGSSIRKTQISLEVQVLSRTLFLTLTAVIDRRARWDAL